MRTACAVLLAVSALRLGAADVPALPKAPTSSNTKAEMQAWIAGAVATDKALRDEITRLKGGTFTRVTWRWATTLASDYSYFQRVEPATQAEYDAAGAMSPPIPQPPPVVVPPAPTATTTTYVDGPRTWILTQPAGTLTLNGVAPGAIVGVLELRDDGTYVVARTAVGFFRWTGTTWQATPDPGGLRVDH